MEVRFITDSGEGGDVLCMNTPDIFLHKRKVASNNSVHLHLPGNEDRPLDDLGDILRNLPLWACTISLMPQPQPAAMTNNCVLGHGPPHTGKSSK